jgi:hypothetical protein
MPESAGQATERNIFTASLNFRQVIRDENWPEFSRKQLLVAAGFSRANALQFIRRLHE